MSKSNHSAVHAKIHTLTGYGVMAGLIGAVFSVANAVRTGSDGIFTWLSSPIGGIGFLAFFTAAIWYCKLEMDEVIMDYFGGQTRALGLGLNKFVAIMLWAAVAFAVIKLAFL